MRCGAAVGCERLRDEALVRATGVPGMVRADISPSRPSCGRPPTATAASYSTLCHRCSAPSVFTRVFGFRDADAYRPKPVQGVRYMSLEI